MTREKLLALVDRAIGGKGIMRVPSWWAKKILTGIVEYTDEAVEKANIKADNAMSDTSVNAVQNCVIKTYVDGFCAPQPSVQNSTEYVYIRDNAPYVEFVGDWFSFRPWFEWSLWLHRIQILDYRDLDGRFTKYNVKFTTPWAYECEVSGPSNFENGKLKLLPSTTYMLSHDGDIASVKCYDIDPSTVEIPDTPGYLSFVALRDGLKVSFSNDIEYSLDGFTWTALAAGEETPSINTGQYVSFRGNLVPTSSGSGIGTFSTSTYCHIAGNTMSLLFGDDFADNNSLEGYDSAFETLFMGTKVYTVDRGILPATTLSKKCYSNMFASCYALTNTPDLPATTLAESCYLAMFYRCTALKKPATFPATTLAPGCYAKTYSNTFVMPDCSNIDWNYAPGLRGLFAYTQVTDADLRKILPVDDKGRYYLPAMDLTENCYESMFEGTLWLRTAPYLPALELKQYCYSRMFYESGITSTPELPGNPDTYSYYYMFYSTNITSIEILCSNSVYHADRMFYGCYNLALIRLPYSSGVYNSAKWLEYAALYVDEPVIERNTNAGLADVPSKWIIRII